MLCSLLSWRNQLSSRNNASRIGSSTSSGLVCMCVCACVMCVCILHCRRRCRILLTQFPPAGVSDPISTPHLSSPLTLVSSLLIPFPFSFSSPASLQLLVICSVIIHTLRFFACAHALNRSFLYQLLLLQSKQSHPNFTSAWSDSIIEFFSNTVTW